MKLILFFVQNFKSGKSWAMFSGNRREAEKEDRNHLLPHSDEAAVEQQEQQQGLRIAEEEQGQEDQGDLLRSTGSGASLSSSGIGTGEEEESGSPTLSSKTASNTSSASKMSVKEEEQKKNSLTAAVGSTAGTAAANGHAPEVTVVDPSRPSEGEEFVPPDGGCRVRERERKKNDNSYNYIPDRIFCNLRS